jgi:hypothetical protein
VLEIGRVVVVDAHASLPLFLISLVDATTLAFQIPLANREMTRVTAGRGYNPNRTHRVCGVQIPQSPFSTVGRTQARERE